MNYLSLLSNCNICPWKCGVNRIKGEKGICEASGENVKIASFNLHHGEEPPISGMKGSGTIFFSGCNMKCVYCQNYPISQFKYGKENTIEELSDIMLDLKNKNAHNINLVTCNHYIPQILKALKIAKERNLNIPIVYNSSGFDSLETIKLIKDYIDIYLVDMRYSDNEYALKYSKVYNYVEINRKAVIEMFYQKGNLITNDYGIAQKGIIIRLLILPNNISGTIETLNFIKENIGNEVYVSVMDQYFPTYKAKEIDELNRRINKQEYNQVIDTVNNLGFNNGWIQKSLNERYI
ncbi:radical SAM protein [candidate division TA06 bacterium]|uniref:Radical SAM protein n=1 Tax=candidate division TA06 bacterium TaxID=2250710 RepID=A0A660SFN5_UNCT6|nr:MAG: radical SAM protein [candidate division TA06 bacterium]